MPKIFVNYRRDDDPSAAARIRDALAARFGRSRVFMDVDDLKAGQDFDEELAKALTQCDVLLAVMGRHWMHQLQRRSAEPRDYVVDEIAQALAEKLLVIPVRVGREGSLLPLPPPGDLPDRVRELLSRQKHDVTHEHFARDVAKLIEALRTVPSRRRASFPRPTPRAIAAGAFAVALVAAGGVAALRPSWLPAFSPQQMAHPGQAVLTTATGVSVQSARQEPSAKTETSDRVVVHAASAADANRALAPETTYGGALPAILAGDNNRVPACVSFSRLTSFVRSRKPSPTADVAAIAAAYELLGTQLGVRWDYAFFQMLIESDNLALPSKAAPGQPVVAEMAKNNFVGLGATSRGEAGESFNTVSDGVRAHLEHLLIYAGVEVKNPISDRTRKVQEWGVLASRRAKIPGPFTFAHLAEQWAPNSRTYAETLNSIARAFAAHCRS